MLCVFESAGADERPAWPLCGHGSGDPHVCLPVVPDTVHRQVPSARRLPYPRSLPEWGKSGRGLEDGVCAWGDGVCVCVCVCVCVGDLMYFDWNGGRPGRCLEDGVCAGGGGGVEGVQGEGGVKVGSVHVLGGGSGGGWGACKPAKIVHLYWKKECVQC